MKLLFPWVGALGPERRLRGCGSRPAQHSPGQGNFLALGHVQFPADQDLNPQLILLASDLECILPLVSTLQKMQALISVETGGALRTGGMFALSEEEAGLEGLTIKAVLWEEFVAQKARFLFEYLVISFKPVVLR